MKGLGVAAVGVAAPARMVWAGEAAITGGDGFAVPVRALVRRHGRLLQPIRITPPVAATELVTRVDGHEVDRRTLGAGDLHAYEVYIEPVEQPRPCSVSLDAGGQVRHARISLLPVRRMLVYVLPHSHHDLGYTSLQAEVEEKQMQNITRGIELAERTAHYPDGARFVWNLEVLWGADLYMRRRPKADREAFIDAVRKGHVAINGAYANELTGLCRPEELLQLFRYGTELGQLCGRPVDAAMISDVPGYTWGTVNAMAQAGIRYFSAAPNYFDRIGRFMATWQDRPFWWQSRSGREKVLFWVPWTGYAMSHVMKADDAWVARYQRRMDEVKFPYDISYVRWSGHGDNALPDPAISEFVRDWNSRYEWPRFAIASTSTAFAAFEKRHGNELPVRSGDLTPYWEDGSGSSARQTAMNRNSADRLVQAAALAAIDAPAAYPRQRFTQAWRDVLLYSEHTWGAAQSVSEPDSPMTTAQWDVKRAFAVDADSRSRALLEDALHERAAVDPVAAVDVRNTTSWPRGGLAHIPAHLSTAGDRADAADGTPLPSQRLADGTLVVQVPTIAGFAGLRVHLSDAAPHAPATAVKVRADALQNDTLQARIDAHSGDIVELRAKGCAGNLVEASSHGAANTFLFMSGNDTAHLQRSGAAEVTIEDHGPLLATLRIASSAPGCRSLVRRVRLAAGADHLQLINAVDKTRAPFTHVRDKHGKRVRTVAKESIQFGFPFDVADGRMRLDLDFAEMAPEVDQLPGGCRNWIPIGRWADVSNAQAGVTWVTLDAPLIEVGGITANKLNSQTDPSVWLKHLKPSRTLYSWVINNHWETNYRAYQEGPVTFRYALRPHGGALDTAEASRFAIGLSQPLLVTEASGQAPKPAPLALDDDRVLVQMFKPSDDGKAWIVRLFGASGQTRKVALHWRVPTGRTWLSDLAEQPLSALDGGAVEVAAWDLVTLRVERA